MKLPKDKHIIPDIDKKILETESLFDEAIDNNSSIDDINNFLNEVAYLISNKYHGPFRVQGESLRELRLDSKKTKYTDRTLKEK